MGQTSIPEVKKFAISRESFVAIAGAEVVVVLEVLVRVLVDDVDVAVFDGSG